MPKTPNVLAASRTIVILALAATAAALATVRDPAQAAEDCPYVAVSTRERADDGVPHGPARVLFATLADHPDCGVVAVNYPGWSNPRLGVEQRRLFYDRNDRLLIDLSFTAVEKGRVAYSWHIWYEVVPDDLEFGIPAGWAPGLTRVSSGVDSLGALLAEYRGPVEAVRW